ncbi:hypothetical protein [Aureibacillus halotolerans]|uniref:Uncharacterized protein n=1 Tax=Aureibacillus halotolerans TaxID=1508390 RepID=A0A4R6UEG0_9BACI|nr:hypothetical protein [Aureibacillus halotolerans]TDQ41474.1 hypothetical protein EV213_10351 [Aureibacillus halotolerans]
MNPYETFQTIKRALDHAEETLNAESSDVQQTMMEARLFNLKAVLRHEGIDEMPWLSDRT